ncbi:hypothetical protein KL928_000223 [Ogataea angusta]|uniref:Uncharacterized protein n=1 Tax=Pichia angusta TaxID=870730 RepID=A0AAN6DL47_PICAN|nr:uncharacterized protein KL928_000223 [Ogataea angusta]KAG7821748.1 hypothetical protein KL928_000223 [Ogataea angusta]
MTKQGGAKADLGFALSQIRFDALAGAKSSSRLVDVRGTSYSHVQQLERSFSEHSLTTLSPCVLQILGLSLAQRTWTNGALHAAMRLLSCRGRLF